MADILFDGQDLSVRSNLNGRTDRLVITFDFWRPRPDDRIHGFCEGLLERLEVDAVHIVSKDNHWFQTPELHEVIRLVQALAGSYEQVIGFGSSMGAFGAMHYAAQMGAQIVLALSPLFSIDVNAPPFERRWQADRVCADERLRLPSSLSKFPPAAIIFYDPLSADARHVELYRSRTFLKEVKLPYSNHPCTWSLSESGLLPGVLMDVVNGTFDVPTFMQHWRQARGQSKFYLQQLVHRTRSKRHRRRLRQRIEGLPAWVSPRVVQIPRRLWKRIWAR